MLENIILIAAGGVAGFGIALAISRNKFARLQSEARERYAALLRELNIETNLNEGLTQELDALATKKK